MVGADTSKIHRAAQQARTSQAGAAATVHNLFMFIFKLYYFVKTIRNINLFISQPIGSN